MKNISVRKTGRTWSVFRGEELVEGGFFSHYAAQKAASIWRKNSAAPQQRPNVEE
jgi:hypothetical protein